MLGVVYLVCDLCRVCVVHTQKCQSHSLIGQGSGCSGKIVNSFLISEILVTELDVGNQVKSLDLGG